MDLADKAEILIEREIDTMIAESKAQLKNNNITGHCVDCDEIIPFARSRALPGCARCIDCQNDFERGV